MRKFFRWQFNNAPYISGDSIADIADTTLFPNRWRVRSNIRRLNPSSKIVFTPSDNLEESLNLVRGTSVSVVIAGNSDRDFDNVVMSVPDSVKIVFAQNLNIVAEGFEVLPIGLENFRLGKNGNPKLFKNLSPWEQRQKRVLIGPFSTTHVEREHLLKFRTSVGPWDYLNNFVSESEYRRIASKYMLVACPRGNGLDTHRFWESLYSGAYPVVMESAWSHHIANLGIPLVSVTSWSENEMLRISNMELLEFSPSEIDPLWTPYWKKRLFHFL